jgi:hypothetical protein
MKMDALSVKLQLGKKATCGVGFTQRVTVKEQCRRENYPSLVRFSSLREGFSYMILRAK